VPRSEASPVVQSRQRAEKGERPKRVSAFRTTKGREGAARRKGGGES